MKIEQFIPDVIAICVVGIVVGLIGLYTLIKQSNER